MDPIKTIYPILEDEMNLYALLLLSSSSCSADLVSSLSSSLVPPLQSVLSNEDDPGCSGPDVSVGDLQQTSGTGAPYIELSGDMGRVCRISCKRPYIGSWISAEADCISQLPYPALVPPGGVLYACFSYTKPPTTPEAVVCTLEVSGDASVPRIVVW